MDAWAPVVQTLLWVLFLSGLLIFGRRRIAAIAEAIRLRVADGSALKATGPAGLSVELSARNADLQTAAPASHHPAPPIQGGLPAWTTQRQRLGEEQRGVHLAHTIAPSAGTDQEYDVYVYLVGTRREAFGQPSDLSDVKYAEFYLGHAWSDTIYKVDPRPGRRIGIKTSAYAPVLCVARVVFSDGHVATISRYLDFEMGEAIEQFAAGS